MESESKRIWIRCVRAIPNRKIVWVETNSIKPAVKLKPSSVLYFVQKKKRNNIITINGEQLLTDDKDTKSIELGKRLKGRAQPETHQVLAHARTLSRCSEESGCDPHDSKLQTATEDVLPHDAEVYAVATAFTSVPKEAFLLTSANNDQNVACKFCSC
jgi:hypothetical protein